MQGTKVGACSGGAAYFWEGRAVREGAPAAVVGCGGVQNPPAFLWALEFHNYLPLPPSLCQQIDLWMRSHDYYYYSGGWSCTFVRSRSPSSVSPPALTNLSSSLRCKLSQYSVGGGWVGQGEHVLLLFEQAGSPANLIMNVM